MYLSDGFGHNNYHKIKLISSIRINEKLIIDNSIVGHDANCLETIFLVSSFNKSRLYLRRKNNNEFYDF